ncbi:MAG: 30S ribosomal protein S21 [Planctomycetota bacterium]|jgi:small subunit ribosomal protein S21|tara:strand:+ start:254 stop:463 length:210 start_codon:yes stop_codon:yes gene_type:complete
MQVKIRKNEASENLIKRFIRKSKKEKILDEFKERRYFKKPSEKRRERIEKAIAENEKKKRKELAEERGR